MSELSKLTKRSDELQTWLSGLASGEGFKQATEALAEVREILIPKCNKLQLKMKDVDPVSGQPRYGPTHIAKIVSLCENVNALERNLATLLSHLESGGFTNNKDDQMDTTTNEPPADAIYTDSGSVFTSALGYTESSRLNEMEKTTMQRQEDIKNNPLLDPLAPMKSELRCMLQTINGTQKGADSFLVQLENMRSGNTSTATATATTKKEVLRFLQGLLVNICSHPDDEKLRLVRIQHPIVYSKLVQPGGLSLLCASGFTILAELEELEQQQQVGDKPDKKTTNSSTDSNSDSIAMNMKMSTATEPVLGVDEVLGPLPVDTNTMELLRIANNLNLRLSAFLKEPTTEDTTAWVAWYDMLTAVRDICIAEFKK